MWVSRYVAVYVGVKICVWGVGMWVCNHVFVGEWRYVGVWVGVWVCE